MGDRPKKRRLRVAEEKSTQLAKGFRKAMTHAEVLLWQGLRRKSVDGLRFRRQHPVGPYIADYACVPVKLVVEVDGATHGSDDELEHDRLRRNYMADRGWRELRFRNSDVYEDLPGVMEVIWNRVLELKKQAPAKEAPSTAFGGPPPPQAGGG